MKILVIIYEFPPIGGGGGRAAYDVCIELAKRGYQITVITAHMQGLTHEENTNGIKIIRIPSLRKEAFRASFVTMLAYVICGIWVGIRYIYKNRPNIIHSHFAVPSGALAWVLSLLTNIPYILTAHLGDVPGGVPEKTDKWFRWLKPFTHIIWKHAKAVVAVSVHTRSLALQHYPVKIQVIPNGVGILQKTLNQINTPVQIVFAGRMVYQKNPLMIVQALTQLKNVDWHCSMLGDGPLFDAVKKEIEKYNLQTHFTLFGWVMPEDVLKQFSKSDILFMPSLSEGLPVTGVQALANGLAFVVSDIGGFADLVDENQNGFLIDTQNTSGYVQALQKLISQPQTLLKFRKASLVKAKQFDIVHVVNQYEDILRQENASMQNQESPLE